MSQPAAAPKKPRKSRKQVASPPEVLPSEMAATPLPRSTTRKAKNVAGADKPTASKAAAPPTKQGQRGQDKKEAGTAAHKAKSGPLGRTSPRPAYASGPSHNDLVGLAVLAAVVVLAVALFWLTGQHGLGTAVGGGLPLVAAA